MAYPMTYLGRSGEQYRSGDDAAEDFLAGIERKRMGNDARKPVAARPGGAGNYGGMEMYTDPVYGWAAAENLKRRRAESERVRNQAVQDEATLAWLDNLKRSATPAVYERGSYGVASNPYSGASSPSPTPFSSPKSYGVASNPYSGADTEASRLQEDTEAREEERNRREYLRNTLQSWRDNPESAQSARNVQQRNPLYENWRQQALADYDEERAQEEATRRAEARDWGVDSKDEAFNRAVKGQEADWKKYRTGVTRNRAIKDLGEKAWEGVISADPTTKKRGVYRKGLLSYAPESYSFVGVEDLDDKDWDEMYGRVAGNVKDAEQRKLAAKAMRQRQAQELQISPEDPGYVSLIDNGTDDNWKRFVTGRQRMKAAEAAGIASAGASDFGGMSEQDFANYLKSYRRDFSQDEYQANLKRNRDRIAAGSVSYAPGEAPRSDPITITQVDDPYFVAPKKVYVSGLGFVTREQARMAGY